MLYVVFLFHREYFTHTESSPLPVNSYGLKCSPMFGAYGLRAGRDFSRDIPATTRDFGVHGVIIGATLL